MSLSFDGKAGTSQTSGASIAAALTTTLTDDIIVAVITLFSNNTNNGSSNAPGVSGVAGGGLQWAQRSRTYIVSSVASDPVMVETWWAHAPTALSAVTITASIFNAGTTDYESLHLFGVNGVDLINPFDPNTSLPAIAAHGTSGGTSSHPVTGISTTNPNTFEFAVLGTAAGGNTTMAADSGFTLGFNEWGNATFGGGQSEYKINSSQLSAVSQNVFASISTVSSNYIAYVDALQAAIVPARTGPVFVNAGGGIVQAATTMTPPLPGNRVNGNLLLAFSSITSGSTTAVWPAGWTVLENWTIGTQNGSKAWRIVDGTETAPVITWTGSCGSMAQVFQFSGVDPVAPFGNSSHNSATGTAVTSTAIATSRANSLVFNYVDAANCIPPPTPSKYTPRASGSINSTAYGGWQASDEIQASSGATIDSVAITLYASTAWLDFVTEIYSNSGIVTHLSGIGQALTGEPLVAGSITTHLSGIGQSLTEETGLWTQLDPGSTKSANVTLSGSNLTATSSNTTPGGAIASPDYQFIGKYYFEATVPASGFGVGLANPSAPTSWSAVQGTSSNDVQVNSFGSIYVGYGNTWGSNTLGSCSAGDKICFAVDAANEVFWVRRNGGNWNGNAQADPATGHFGIFYGLVNNAPPAGVVAPFVVFNAAVAVTFNFGGSAFAQTVPSGFTSGWPIAGNRDVALVSQVGAEAWVNDPANMNVTQVGVEAWIASTLIASSLIATQIGVEVWRSTADMPVAGAAGPAALLIGL